MLWIATRNVRGEERHPDRGWHRFVRANFYALPVHVQWTVFPCKYLRVLRNLQSIVLRALTAAARSCLVMMLKSRRKLKTLSDNFTTKDETRRHASSFHDRYTLTIVFMYGCTR